MTISVILVPVVPTEALRSLDVSWDNPDCDSFSKDIRQFLDQSDYLETPLLRPRHGVAGLYAYHNIPDDKQGQQNLRATRLAMACGLLSSRLYGPILLVRSYGGRWESLEKSEIFGALCVSPDLRMEIQQQIVKSFVGMETTKLVEAPGWLADAAQQNYHDGAALAKVISAMKPSQDGSDQSSDDESEDGENTTKMYPTTTIALSSTTEFVAKSPLCLYCRRSSSQLCPSCGGAYFCSPAERPCYENGWSHFCLCATWKLYTGMHREALADFNGVFGEWQAPLTSRPYQLGEGPYEDFLRSLGIDTDDCVSWWRTELGGWAGGESSSASQVDAAKRQSYAQGFAPIIDVPPERRIHDEDLGRAQLQGKRNSVGLIHLSSWKDYYNLRNIPPSSPVCLICTFPLTIYYAIEQFGDVPVTVARMLGRPLRIHVVGSEKELNFLDLFQELTFLLPEYLKVSERCRHSVIPWMFGPTFVSSVLVRWN